MANLLKRLREAVSTGDLPQVQRQGDDPIRETDYSTEERVNLAKNGKAIPVRNKQGDIVGGRYPIKTAQDAKNAISDYGRAGGGSEEKAHIAKHAKQHGVKLPDGWKARESTALLFRVREATLTKSGNAYEVTIVCEGPGNSQDRNYYTKQALREAVNKGMFEGLQGYLNHPTPTEERERPERDVRYLAGHFREARFVDGNPAEVRAKFIPGGMDAKGVTSLIESALESVPGKPLIGISIDGEGHAPDQQEINGRTYNMVREVTHLGSADIVTRAGAGGQFHRRLQEAWRNTDRSNGGGSDTPGGAMKPATLQGNIKAAVAKLEEAAGLEEKDGEKADKLVEEALVGLRESATAEIEPVVQIQEKIVEKPVAASDDEKDQIATKLRESEIARETAQAEAKTERKARKAAESKLQENEQVKLAAKVLREAKVPEKSARSWFDEVVEQESEQAMVALVERKLAEREELLSELRESYGVEGAPARTPSLSAVPSSGGLLDRMGIDRDELAAA